MREMDLVPKDGDCGKPVGNIVTYPCRIDRDHSGPCAAPEVQTSMTMRRRWEEKDTQEDPQARQEPAVEPSSLVEVQGPTKVRPGDQRLPQGGGECVQDLVIAAMEESKRVGTERYGQPLMTFNGRKGIQDVAEEARDLMVYLTMIQREAEADYQQLVNVVSNAIRTADGDHTKGAGELAEVAVTSIMGWVTAQRMLPQAQAEATQNDWFTAAALLIYTHAGLDAEWLISDDYRTSLPEDVKITVREAPEFNALGMTLRRGEVRDGE